jgi:xanthine dehydrogenase molybdopterin-binding subunit B
MKLVDECISDLLADGSGGARNEISAPERIDQRIKPGPARTYVGDPVERTEDLRFLRGQGQYIDDIKRKGQLHAAFVRTTSAHGILRGIDATAALAIPGVHAVITAADIPGPIPTIPFRRPNPTVAPYGQPVIASGRVRYVGEPVAMVLADSAELAEDVLQEITVHIDDLPAVVDWHTSENGGTLLFENTTSNVAQYSRPVAATPMRHSRMRPMCGANAFACSARRPCPWRRADCWRSGTRFAAT